MKVFIIAAQSVDGFIGLDETHLATSWTTTADKRFFVRMTKQAGVVVMGRKTFRTFDKPLKERRLIVLTSKPGDINIEGVEATNEDPTTLTERLKHEGVAEIAVCGGASVYAQFMKAHLVDELYITVMPKLFGQGVPMFNEQLDVNLELISSETLDDDNSVLNHYRVTS